MGANYKYMVLMQTRIDGSSPDRASSEFVGVSTFRHENVASLHRIALDGGSFDLNLFHFSQIEVPVLHVCDSEIRYFNAIYKFLLAFGKTRSNLCDGV